MENLFRLSTLDVHAWPLRLGQPLLERPTPNEALLQETGEGPLPAPGCLRAAANRPAGAEYRA